MQHERSTPNKLLVYRKRSQIPPFLVACSKKVRGGRQVCAVYVRKRDLCAQRPACAHPIWVGYVGRVHAPEPAAAVVKEEACVTEGSSEVFLHNSVAAVVVRFVKNEGVPLVTDGRLDGCVELRRKFWVGNLQGRCMAGRANWTNGCSECFDEDSATRHMGT